LNNRIFKLSCKFGLDSFGNLVNASGHGAPSEAEGRASIDTECRPPRWGGQTLPERVKPELVNLL